MKSKIPMIFLFDFKMGFEAVETTHSINNAFGPGTANECTVQWWFKKFFKGDESLEDEECRGQPSEVDNSRLRAKLMLLNLYEKLLKNSTLTILWSFDLKQIEKVKKLDKWVLRELTKKKKNCCF